MGRGDVGGQDYGTSRTSSSHPGWLSPAVPPDSRPRRADGPRPRSRSGL